MSAAQILRQAEILKSRILDGSVGSEAWVCRQSLQDYYQKALIIDLEYSLDKKVEQDLWNYAFKNQINSMQVQCKDKQNSKRAEVLASLNLFLETATGFYLQFLQEICSTFRLDLPFRKKSSFYGIMSARYRQQNDQAQTYYRHAANLVPYNGQPYNQLAIIEAAKSNKLSTVFYYVKSLSVKYPFSVAATNLEKLYVKISKEETDFKGKLSTSEFLETFLQFHAMIHLSIDLEVARRHGDKLAASLSSHVSSTSFTSFQLVQMSAINLYAFWSANKSQYVGENKKADALSVSHLSAEEKKAHGLILSLIVSMLRCFVQATPKQEQRIKDYRTLPAIKILLDWLLLEREIMALQSFKNTGLWGHLSKLLNNLQFIGASVEIDSYLDHPLPEDVDLQSFYPVYKAHSGLNFNKVTAEGLPTDVEVKLRSHRLLEIGKRICEEYPSLNVMNFQTLKSGKKQFSSPTVHIKVLPGDDDAPAQEKKMTGKNVAIQAIMQNRTADVSSATKGGPRYGSPQQRSPLRQTSPGRQNFASPNQQQPPRFNSEMTPNQMAQMYQQSPQQQPPPQLPYQQPSFQRFQNPPLSAEVNFPRGLPTSIGQHPSVPATKFSSAPSAVRVPMPNFVQGQMQGNDPVGISSEKQNQTGKMPFDYFGMKTSPSGQPQQPLIGHNFNQAPLVPNIHEPPPNMKPLQSAAPSASAQNMIVGPPPMNHGLSPLFIPDGQRPHVVDTPGALLHTPANFQEQDDANFPDLRKISFQQQQPLPNATNFPSDVEQMMQAQREKQQQPSAQSIQRPMLPARNFPAHGPNINSYSLFSQSPWLSSNYETTNDRNWTSFGQMVGHAAPHREENNPQSMWGSGPSPLEKLLEQQKQQRQNEPH